EVRPGPEPGTSALILDVKDRLPLHGRVEFNDYNTPGTPSYRVNANVAYNNLWQLEHSIGFQYGFSPQEMKKDLDDSLPMYIGPMDTPLIAYYSAFYRAPLAGPEPVTSRIAGDTRFGFNEATRQFVMPPPGGRPELTIYGTRSTTDDGLRVSAR